jgi:hypothetical protein
VHGLVTPATVVQLPAPDGLNWRNPVAASCVPSIAGAVQVTVRLLPLPGASDGALGGFAIRVVGGCGGVAESRDLKGCIVAIPRFGTIGVGRYTGICVENPIVAPSMW